MTAIVRLAGSLVLAFLAILRPMAAAAAEPEVAIFAGGCFWCVESDFDHVPGVISTTSGYIGGSLDNPSYKQVSAGGTGHREAVKIEFDPDRISYEAMLDVFWHSIDPTDPKGQFCDRGHSYTTAIYTTSEAQTSEAEASRQAIEASGALPAPVVTAIEAAGTFYPAEDYHQNYYDRNPIQYRFYRFTCGRDSRVEELWGDAAHRGIPTG